jgi:hypothetical protein
LLETNYILLTEKRMEGSIFLPTYGKGLGSPPSVGKSKFTV